VDKVVPIEQMVVQEHLKLVDAMKVINKNEQGICFVLANKNLVGVLTDGDIRRSLLQGRDTNDCLKDIINRDFFSLSSDSSTDNIQKSLIKYRCIPITNHRGELVDYASAISYSQIPLIKPVLDGRELEYITDCILTGWISSQGKYVNLFEEGFSQYVGGTHCLAVSNGTVALHLALAPLGIGPGDEVLVPNLTFAASVNPVLYVGATPVLIDVDPTSMAIDVNLAEQAITPRTRAIIPVHLYGHPADIDRVMALADKFQLLVIEDCAEAFGSFYKGKHVGRWGDAAIFSFFGNKTLTTGEGGMVLFKDKAIYDRARILRDHGMSPERRYWHDEVGYNYRMTNLQAAVGVAQLERADFFVERKRWIAEQYRKRLSLFRCLKLPQEYGDVTNSYWLYTILLTGEVAPKRDQIIKLMKLNGIETRPVFYSMHRMPPYRAFSINGASYPVSSYISDSGISLPSGVTLEISDIARVCDSLAQVLDTILSLKSV